MAFYPAYRFGGGPIEAAKDLYVAAATAIEKGEIVKYTAGTGVVAIGDADQDDPYFGISAEAHDGSTAGRQSGTKIDIYNAPDLVYGIKPANALTATGGSTTTFVDSNLPNVDDLFNGGYIEVLTCAAGLQVGKMIPITDYTGSSGTITFATQSAAFASGDTVYLYPGKLAIGHFAFDLDSDGTDIDFETTGGESLIIVDANAEKKRLYVKLRLHQLGNHVVAI